MALNKNKCDEKLGIEVNNYLKEIGKQTPVDEPFLQRDNDIKLIEVEKCFKEIMRTLGLDLNDDSLQDTPRRVSKMFVNEIFWGLKNENFPKCTTVENKMNYDEMVIEKNITSMSACEHHFVTIDGLAHIAYIPKNKVLGLSKLNRIVEYFSRRPQIQERLTEQIYYALHYILETDDIAVVIEGKHYCVKSRGVEDNNSSTITSKMGGRFMTKPELRKEFMDLIR